MTESALDRARLSISERLRQWWRFSDTQQPTSSWHDREDFIDGELQHLLDRLVAAAQEDVSGLMRVAKERELAAARLAGRQLSLDWVADMLAAHNDLAASPILSAVNQERDRLRLEADKGGDA